MNRVPVDSHKLSGPERGEIHVETLRAYLEKLTADGQPLPTGGDGRPAISAISNATGIPRNSFYTNKGIKKLLDAFSGASPITAASDGDATARYQELLELRDRRILQLEQRLAASLAEAQELRKRLAEAETQLGRYRVIEDDILKAGRRIIP